MDLIFMPLLLPPGRPARTGRPADRARCPARPGTCPTWPGGTGRRASSEVQGIYASELEAVMGAAARYATANKNTFETLSWSNKESTALKQQWQYAFGLPQVAGGYYTERHITNAIRKVINENEDPRETLLDYCNDIDEELTTKRKEFGLPTAEDDGATNISEKGE